MRIFIETIVKMVCPVFLAACVSLAKLDMADQPGVRDSLSILAGCTLASGILSLLPLILPNRFLDKLLKGFSVVFVYLCGLLLMVLAYLTLVLISKRYVSLWIALVIIAGFTLYWGIVTFVTLLNGQARGATVFGKYLDELENSVDFSASITFLLFLGLGGLVLGGQYSTVQLNLPEGDKDMLLLFFHTIWLSFFICIAGVFFMLACIVPPVSRDETELIVWWCHNIQGFDCFFGCALASIVVLITIGTLRNWAVLAFGGVLSLLPYIVWLFRICDSEAGDVALDGGAEEEDVMPASLDLTKVTFTGFVAISVYTISENSPVSIHEYSSWFIFFTAIAVTNGLGWRLLTHQKKPSSASFTAANVASFGAHLYIVVAAIPFACMAFDALRKITTIAPSPTPCS
ncbi:unnamed protein product [Alopecurus aequalis]